MKELFQSKRFLIFFIGCLFMLVTFGLVLISNRSWADLLACLTFLATTMATLITAISKVEIERERLKAKYSLSPPPMPSVPPLPEMRDFESSVLDPVEMDTKVGKQ